MATNAEREWFKTATAMLQRAAFVRTGDRNPLLDEALAAIERESTEEESASERIDATLDRIAEMRAAAERGAAK